MTSPSVHPSLERLEHRPWSLPPGRWTWRQRWCDLLFAHWAVPPAALRPLVPESVEVQTFDGSAWVGVVPFRMVDVARRPLPPLPGVSTFPEINVRTYVECEGKAGVWFLSLDASNPLAVWVAQRFYHLPYFRARFHLTSSSAVFEYSSSRVSPANGPAFQASYRPSSAPYEARPGSLEHWLTERYCLYAQSPSGRVLRTEVHHRPWQLQAAEAEILRNELGRPHGLTLDAPPDLLHFSRDIHVVMWPSQPVAV